MQITRDRGSDCRTKLGDPFRIESKIIEEIPESQTLTVDKYNICHYICPYCKKTVVGTGPDCLNEGMFGNNAVVHVALLELIYGDRLQHRKIKNSLKRGYRFVISPATILNFTHRVANGRSKATV